MIFWSQIRYLVTSSCVLNKLKFPPYAMSKIYFRWKDDSDNFDVTFHLILASLRIERHFNFTRRLAEPVNGFVDRIKQNLEKVITRKRKRKGREAEAIPFEVKVEIFSNGAPVPGDAICQDVFFTRTKTKPKVQFFIFDICYDVVVNSPWVLDLAIPGCMFVDYPVYPSKVIIAHGDQEKSQFIWYKTPMDDSGRENWQETGKDFFFFPKEEDLDHRLKLVCIPGNGTDVGPPVETLSKAPVQKGPGPCPYEKRHKFTAEKLTGNSFRVLTYNILADVYAETSVAKNDLFPYCPPHALTVNYRKQLYIKEILGYNADIICLQEVDFKIYHGDIGNVLNHVGFNSYFCKKGGTVNEGLAFFYNTDKFDEISKKRVVLGEELETDPVFVDIWKGIKHNQAVSNRIKDKPTTVQVVVLQYLSRPNDVLVVGNTHLYFSPDADHIRLLQGALIMRLIESTVTNIKLKRPGCRVSTIICGDFNSTPDCSVYQLITTKSISATHVDWRSNSKELIDPFPVTQPFNMASACGTPEFTNFTASYAGCLDYIYYQTDRLRVIQSVPVPSETELNENTAIPSLVFPSDHISLIADLELAD